MKLGQHVVLSEDTRLAREVTVGNNVTFYPGVTVGDDSVILDGAVIGRPPIRVGVTTRELNLPSFHVSIGSGCVIGANSVLYTGIQIADKVLIGDLASIREGCRIGKETVIGRNVLIMYDTVIGARTRIIDGTIITGNMVIEDDVFIGPGVNTINDNDVYLKRFGLIPFSVRGPVIHRYALIGTGATLAAGVNIGEGAIVAPHSMVTSDVEAWTIVAGIPAKYVRKVDDETRQLVLRSANARSS